MVSKILKQNYSLQRTTGTRGQEKKIYQEKSITWTYTIVIVTLTLPQWICGV